jgi:dCMP deaminase
MKWRSYYGKFAALAAQKSKDTTKVGAVLVGADGEIRLTGFNGIPRGVEDLPSRLERPTKYVFTSHAEANIIAFAAREGIRTKGCSLYTTHFPCSDCAKLIVQAGIVCVSVNPDETYTDPARWAEGQAAAREMFREAGIAVDTATTLED